MGEWPAGIDSVCVQRLLLKKKPPPPSNSTSTTIISKVCVSIFEVSGRKGVRTMGCYPHKCLVNIGDILSPEDNSDPAGLGKLF